MKEQDQTPKAGAPNRPKTYVFQVAITISRKKHEPIRCDTIALALEHAPELDLGVDVVHIKDLTASPILSLTPRPELGTKNYTFTDAVGHEGTKASPEIKQ